MRRTLKGGKFGLFLPASIGQVYNARMADSPPSPATLPPSPATPDSLMKLLVALVGVLVLLLGGLGLYWAGRTSQPQEHASQGAVPGSLLYDRLHELDGKILRMEAALALKDRDLASLGDQLRGLQASLESLRATSAETPSGVSPAQLKALADQVTAMAAQLASMATPPQAAPVSADAPEPEPKDPPAPTDTPEALERQAKNYFERIRPKFQDAIDKHQYDDARWLMLNFPKRLLNTPTGERVQQMAAQVAEQMWADYRNLEKLAEDYASKGKVAEAMELLKAVPQRYPGQPEIHARAKEMMVKVMDERQRQKVAPSPGVAVDDVEVAALIEEMGSEDPKKVTEAKVKLREVGLRGLGQIRKATVHDNPRVRWGAVTLLGQFSDSESEAALISALRDKDTQVRWSALEALRKLKSYKAIDEIVKLAADEDFKLAELAVRTFEGILEHPVLLGNTTLTKENIRAVQESMAIYWERHRKDFIDKAPDAPK